jgi:hypothetical protein
MTSQTTGTYVDRIGEVVLTCPCGLRTGQRLQDLPS